MSTQNPQESPEREQTDDSLREEREKADVALAAIQGAVEAKADAVVERARENGLLIGKGGLFGNVIRMAPPMNISKADVDEGIRMLDKSLNEVRI